MQLIAGVSYTHLPQCNYKVNVYSYNCRTCHVQARLLGRVLILTIMNWDAASIATPPPRYDLESDEEEIAPDNEVVFHPNLQLLGDIPALLERSLVVLLGNVGTAVMLASKRIFPEVACIDVDSHGRIASIHAPFDTQMPCVLSIPQAEDIPVVIQSLIAKLVMEKMRPVSMVIMQGYTEALYCNSMGLSETDSSFQPLRYLSNVPMNASPTRPSSDVAPWETPNSLSGCGAAFFMHAVYRHTPVQIFCVPSAQVAPHPNYQRRLMHFVAPHGHQSLSSDEARRRLNTLIPPLEEQHLETLGPMLGKGSEACDGSSSLLVHALLATLATRPSVESLGEGGMYI